MGSMAQCINTSECASQYFVHGSLYDLLLIMSIICHLHSLLGIGCLLGAFANIMNYSQKPWRTTKKKTPPQNDIQKAPIPKDMSRRK